MKSLMKRSMVRASVRSAFASASFSLLLASSFLVGCSEQRPVVTTKVTVGSTVKIELSDGIGSGVHLGNGLIITAAHVVGDKATVLLKSEDGYVQTGTVLWVNKTYDIAAVRPEKPWRIGAAELACVSPKIGDVVTAEGNPAGLEFVTMHGFVSGKERDMSPNWKVAVLTDMTTIGGMSGGPTFNSAGEVIGITVGVNSLARVADGGLGFIVPGSVVCQLLGRELVSTTGGV